MSTSRRHDSSGTTVLLLLLADGIRRLPTFVPDAQLDEVARVCPPFLSELTGFTASRH